ncbi:glycosyltransferase family 4 protein [Sulfobacillus thermosulfidooxidans]|uniref:glycosyltransferase family 4 protein n=1 Tax=Sulfobacillus thermosulfidooxidans TaxID=28034 RepID=UPI0003FD3C2C|nr:glycosyltransferase family 1 protein [Sulfobacillus thermosulfidooxidans]
MDVRVLSAQKERVGIAQYIACLLTEYQYAHRDVTLEPLSYETDQSGRAGVAVRAIPRVKGIPWQSLLLPWHLRRHHYDVFHGPAFSIPPFSSVPSVVTIHDAAFYRMPEVVRSDTVRYLMQVVPRSLRNASKIIVPSWEVREDLLKMASGLSPDRIAVIALGSDRLRDIPPSPASFLEAPYFLHVGTIEPRKNLEFLLEVFNEIVTKGHLPHHLVLAGSNGWNNESFWRAYENFPLKDRVHILGYVSDSETVRLYHDAAIYLSPSHYEGFGLGSFEALWHGCPVIASPTGGVKDHAVAGLYVLPTDRVELWAQKIMDMVNERVDVDQKALPTWQETYSQHAALYHEVSHGKR